MNRRASVNIILIATFIVQLAGAAAAWWAFGWMYGLLVLGVLAVLGELPLVLALHRYVSPAAGVEAMPGGTARMAMPFEQREQVLAGKVRFGGELWEARARDPAVAQLPAGAPVRIRTVRGMVLEVEPITAGEAER